MSAITESTAPATMAQPLSKGAGLEKQHRGSTPEDINVHYSDNDNKNAPEHTASLGINPSFIYCNIGSLSRLRVTT